MMVRLDHFIAFATILAMLQMCICNPIAPGEEKDVTKMATPDELQRARSVGIRDREIINGIMRGVTVDEMIKLTILQKSEPSQIAEPNDTSPAPITLEETTKLCEIFAPQYVTAKNLSTDQNIRLNEVWRAMDDFPRDIQFLYLRNSLCAYASEPQQIERCANSMGLKLLPFVKFRFWMLKYKNATGVERISAAKHVCCVYKGQGQDTKDTKDAKTEKKIPTTSSLSNEKIKNFEKLWSDFDTARTPASFEQVCSFLRVNDPTDTC